MHSETTKVMESLCVRFHYRGKLEYVGNEWKHIGGRSSCSIVPISNLSLSELKRHFSDHVSISDKDLQATRLSWRLIERKKNCNFLCSLDDNTMVNSMARHVTRVADGYVDIYARMPDNATFDSSEEENGVDHLEVGQGQHDHEHHQIQHQVENQVEHQVDHEHHQVQHPVENQVDHVQHQLEHQLEHQTVPNSEMFIEEENVEQRRPLKLPVVRAPIEENCGESSDSDYDAVHEVDTEDSSADDDEAICYRQQALELKNRVKRKMLGDDEAKTTKVPEEFIVPENVKLEQDDGSECFDSEDELSYDEDSDGEGNVRTRKTKHRVYDENADVKEFELGQCFHDSREFKQAVVNRIDVYDQVYSHVLEPVEGKESWPVATNPRPFPPVKMKMPGRPKTERRREEQEKPKGNKLSRKGCVQRCSMCGSENHNKRKCIGNPDVVTEYAEKKKAAKRSRKKRDEATAQQASSSGQQQERHVLYVEKKSTSKKEAPRHTPQQAPRHAQQQAPIHAEQHAQPRPRPFVPPKKKKIPKAYDGASQSSASLQIPRRQTIPMCEVVTESVPKHGRLRWYFGGNERTNEGGEGGDGQE